MRKVCPVDAREFDAQRRSAVYCSARCKQRAHRRPASALASVVSLDVQVSTATAAAVEKVADRLGETVAELLLEYVEAIADGRRLQLLNDDEDLIGYSFLFHSMKG